MLYFPLRKNGLRICFAFIFLCCTVHLPPRNICRLLIFHHCMYYIIDKDTLYRIFRSHHLCTLVFRLHIDPLVQDSLPLLPNYGNNAKEFFTSLWNNSTPYFTSIIFDGIACMFAPIIFNNVFKDFFN